MVPYYTVSRDSLRPRATVVTSSRDTADITGNIRVSQITRLRAQGTAGARYDPAYMLSSLVCQVSDECQVRTMAQL